MFCLMFLNYYFHKYIVSVVVILSIIGRNAAMKISITKALAELKLLDKRIKSAVEEANFVTVQRGEKALLENGLDKDQFLIEARASKQKILALINRRARIKESIINSNATTQVIVGDWTGTVAAAIERKNSAHYERLLFTKILEQFTKANLEVERFNYRLLPARADEAAKGFAGEKSSSEEYMKLHAAFTEKHSYKLIVPARIREEAGQLKENLDRFLLNVDVALSEVNARTEIEVED
jgi:hypothetical protein